MTPSIDEELRTQTIAFFHALLSGNWKKHGHTMTQVFERACDLAFDAGLDINIPWVDSQGQKIVTRARTLRDWCLREDCPTWKRAAQRDTNRLPGMKRRM